MASTKQSWMSSTATSTNVTVGTAAGVVEWGTDSTGELFQTRDTGGFLESRLFDSISLTTASDLILADATVIGPGQPNMGVNESTVQLGDQAFLDVFIA
jgi:hypothetical protein